MFFGAKTGVQIRLKVHTVHALYIHYSCHRLQLASIQAAELIGPVKRMFGEVTSLFHYILEILKHV